MDDDNFDQKYIHVGPSHFKFIEQGLLYCMPVSVCLHFFFCYYFDTNATAALFDDAPCSLHHFICASFYLYSKLSVVHTHTAENGKMGKTPKKSATQNTVVYVAKINCYSIYKPKTTQKTKNNNEENKTLSNTKRTSNTNMLCWSFATYKS